MHITFWRVQKYHVYQHTADTLRNTGVIESICPFVTQFSYLSQYEDDISIRSVHRQSWAFLTKTFLSVNPFLTRWRHWFLPSHLHLLLLWVTQLTSAEHFREQPQAYRSGMWEVKVAADRRSPTDETVKEQFHFITRSSLQQSPTGTGGSYRLSRLWKTLYLEVKLKVSTQEMFVKMPHYTGKWWLGQ